MAPNPQLDASVGVTGFTDVPIWPIHTERRRGISALSFSASVWLRCRCHLESRMQRLRCCRVAWTRHGSHARLSTSAPRDSSRSAGGDAWALLWIASRRAAAHLTSKYGDTRSCLLWDYQSERDQRPGICTAPEKGRWGPDAYGVGLAERRQPGSAPKSRSPG